MKSAFSFLLIVLLAAATANAEIQTDWAYHAVGSSGRLSELVPGETFTFLANGSDQIPDGDPCRQLQRPHSLQVANSIVPCQTPCRNRLRMPDEQTGFFPAAKQVPDLHDPHSIVPLRNR